MISTLQSHRILLLLALFALIALTGCGDDDDPVIPGGGTPVITTGSISCTIDGTALTLNDNAAGVADGNGGIVIVGGDTSTNSVLTMTVPDAEGTYTFGTPNGVAINMVYNTLGYIVPTASGTLVVTDLDTGSIKGTFSLTMTNIIVPTDTIVVTNGTFDVPLAK
jgi:hypothetical protein